MLSTAYRLRLVDICKSIAAGTEVTIEDMIWAEKLAKANTSARGMLSSARRLRGGDEHWIDRFFAKHLVLLYYWIMVAYYLIDPIDAYDINMKIEKHAFETYVKYGAYHPEDTKIQEIAQDEYEHSKELQKAMLMIA